LRQVSRESGRLPGPRDFGDVGIPCERIFRLTDEVKVLRDALNAK